MKKVIIAVTAALLIVAGYQAYKIWGAEFCCGQNGPTPAGELPAGDVPDDATAMDGSATTSVYVYYIDLESKTGRGEAVGCGDAVVAVRRDVPQTQGVLRAAYEELLKTKDRDIVVGSATYYNTIAQSDISLESVAIENGIATVRIKGELRSGGVCDDPRIIAQLKETAEQFPTVRSSEIFINNLALEEYFSAR